MNNQGILNKFVINDLINEMNELINFYEQNFEYKKIRSSKIQTWINTINNSKANDLERFELFFNIRRYTRALKIFKENSSNINKETITKMLSGGNNSKNDNSDDYFFEIDMARRFLSREDYEFINLKENTDLIFKSKNLEAKWFIECKNIRSQESFEKNVRKANNQLDKAINEEKSRSIGIIALNLSDIFNKDEFLNLLNPIINNLIKSNYKQSHLQIY